MPIRPELARKLRDALGPEAADQMADWMRDVERAGERDVALRGDVAELRHATTTEFAAVRQEIQSEAGKLRQEIQSEAGKLRQEIQSEAGKLRQEIQSEAGKLRDGFASVRYDIAQLEVRLERRLGDVIKWSFVFWVGAVGAVAMLAGVVG